MKVASSMIRERIALKGRRGMAKGQGLGRGKNALDEECIEENALDDKCAEKEHAPDDEMQNAVDEGCIQIEGHSFLELEHQERHTLESPPPEDKSVELPTGGTEPGRMTLLQQNALLYNQVKGHERRIRGLLKRMKTAELERTWYEKLLLEYYEVGKEKGGGLTYLLRDA